MQTAGPGLGQEACFPGSREEATAELALLWRSHAACWGMEGCSQAHLLPPLISPDSALSPSVTLLQAAPLVPQRPPLRDPVLCLQVRYLQRPIALWCGLNHSLVLSQGSDFSKELLGCGCGAGGRLPGWPKGSASFVKLHIKVRAQAPARGQLGRAGAIEPRGLELGLPLGPRDPTSQHCPLPFPAVYHGSWLSP